MTSPPLSQDRSRARREALLRAAISLLADGGTRAVTHRAVAARAGVPAAATTYYFQSIQHLTEAALQLHVEERVLELRELAAAAETDGGNAEQVAARFVQVLNERDPRATIAQFEVFLEAARNPGLRETVAETLEAFEDLTRTVLAKLGAHRPDQAAASFVALINGFAIHRLARPSRADGEHLLQALRSMFLVQLLSDDELAGFMRRLSDAPTAGPWRLGAGVTTAAAAAHTIPGVRAVIATPR